MVFESMVLVLPKKQPVNVAMIPSFRALLNRDFIFHSKQNIEVKVLGVPCFPSV